MSTDRIVLLGGYGAVGRHVFTALTNWFPGSVVVAGRNLDRARQVTDNVAHVDLGDLASVRNVVANASAVVMCADRDNARIARVCLEQGTDYVDVSAAHLQLGPIEALQELARKHSSTAVLSVGLAPGVTNLLARRGVDVSGSTAVQIGVLLGTGESHGAGALDWTLDALADMGPGWRITFPPPHGTRAVHRFPFSDQYTLPRTLGLDNARTGLCLASPVLTSLMTSGRIPAVARILACPRARRAILAALTRVHVGGDEFSVIATADGVTNAFSGTQQSRATGIAAALIVRGLNAFPSGVWHIDQLVDPEEFLTELASYGFDLVLDPAQS